MHRKLKFLSSVFLVVLMITCIHISAWADFGDFAGSSDYGDSDYSYDSDYDGGGGGVFDIPSFIFASVIMAVFVWRIFNNQVEGVNRKTGAVPRSELRPMEEIRLSDPAFSPDELKQRISNLYVQMQNCWQARDISPLRGNFTDAQFAQYNRQLQQYRDKGHIPVVERIAVLDVSLRGVKPDNVYDVIIVNLSTRITIYTLDDRTGKIVNGDRNKEKFMNYEWTLIRPKGAKTIPQRGDRAFNCPNCSAPLNINHSAQCPYCGSIVSRSDYDWVIAGIKGLSQRTV